MIRELRFNAEDSDRAWADFRFNCGPGALCAVLGMTPNEIRPHLLDFEKKGYTNPTLMFDILKGLGVKHQCVYRADDPLGECDLRFGLMRVQWGGPWAKAGVPMQARYRQTHWVATAGDYIFDINAVYYGWITFARWKDWLVPWIIRECVPKGDGTWWPTHGIEIIS